MTSLVISGDGLSEYSTLNVTQTLEPIDAAGNFRRTVNGTLFNLSPAQFSGKYKSTISGGDQDAPAFDAVQIGDTLTIDCASELSYLTAGGSPEKTVVPGSSVISGNYTFYRPRLVMMVFNKREEFDETAWSNVWVLELEEV